MRHTDEMFAQLWNRVSALFRRGGAHVVASPPAAVLYLQGRHWQHKYLDVLADLRVLEEVYSLPWVKNSPGRAHMNYPGS